MPAIPEQPTLRRSTLNRTLDSSARPATPYSTFAAQGTGGNVKLNITFEMQQAIINPKTRYAALAQLAEKARVAGFKHAEVLQ